MPMETASPAQSSDLCQLTTKIILMRQGFNAKDDMVMQMKASLLSFEPQQSKKG